MPQFDTKGHQMNQYEKNILECFGKRVYYNLVTQKSRYQVGHFSDDLQLFCRRRIESLEQRGFLEALGIDDAL